MNKTFNGGEETLKFSEGKMEKEETLELGDLSRYIN